jgi:hypothetical protein
MNRRGILTESRAGSCRRRMPEKTVFAGSVDSNAMFNFSANHLKLICRTEYRFGVVFLMRDHYTQRVYRLYDFKRAQTIEHELFYCVSGKVNSADHKLYLVIESVKPDTKHPPESNAQARTDRAGGR